MPNEDRNLEAWRRLHRPGYTSMGQLCTCGCHQRRGMLHFRACCERRDETETREEPLPSLDIDRMETSLAGDSFPIPANLAREELRDTFLSAAQSRSRPDGSRIYPYLCGSPSKSRDYWLGYETHAEALEHQRSMEVQLETYDDPDSKWDKSFWTTKPEPWIVILNPEWTNRP